MCSNDIGVKNKAMATAIIHSTGCTNATKKVIIHMVEKTMQRIAAFLKSFFVESFFIRHGEIVFFIFSMLQY